MLTNEQLAKIEKYAHPRTQDGKLILRLCEELRIGAANYRRACADRDAQAAAHADLLLAINERGLRVERDGAAVVLASLEGGAA